MKLLPIFSLFIISLNGFANSQADVLCTGRIAGENLVADAKGSVHVNQLNDFNHVSLSLDLRLFSEFGNKKGSEFKSVELCGEIAEGNDHFYMLTKPVVNHSIIEEVIIDFSTFEKGMSHIKTKKGNKYLMDCVVRFE